MQKLIVKCVFVTINFITNISDVSSWSTSGIDTTYTATDDCVVTGWLTMYNVSYTDGTELRVNNSIIGKIGSTGTDWSIQYPIFIYLKKKDLILEKYI